MISLARLSLLALFVSAGVGLAVCVGLSSGPLPNSSLPESLSLSPPPARQPTERSSDVPPTESDDSQPAVAEVAESTTEAEIGGPPPQAADQAASVPLPTTAAIPPGPVVVQPYPARALQVSADSDDDRLLKAFQYLADRLAPQPAAEAVPAPASVEETTAADDQPPLPKGPPETPIQTKNQITRSASGEGDDKLSITIQDADIREVLEALSEQGGLNILASNSVQGQVSATLHEVDVESALDAILKSTGFVARREGRFIYVGTPQDFETLEESLDTVSTRVYRPNYVTAAELQALIEPLVTEGIGVVSVSSPAEAGIEKDETTAGGDGFAGGEVVLVRDYEAVLAQIDQVVAEIDTRPLQVAIEAMILSVKLDDSNEFGVNFELLRNNDNIRLGWGTPLEALSKPTFEFKDGGLKFGFLDSSLGAFLKALETVGDTNVIATPRIMVLNKHRAEILIGEQLGYVSTTITETSSSQTVEFLDVGAQLRLRPFISSDGLVRMEIHPELSTGSVDTESGFTLPNKETTQVTSNIMVRDGCTVIIGGLMREELKTTGTQVPLFGSLPLVGAAFRSMKETIERREIIVLITPHIVYEPDTCQEGRQTECEFLRRQDTYAEKMNPVGKRAIAKRYFRMAQNAWAAGRQRAALRFAEMAVHFDPLSREAIDLRTSIWLGDPPAGLDFDGLPAHVPPTLPLDGAVIDPWLLEELERQPAAPPPVPLHPLDPGIPGRHTDVKRPRSLQ